jgi:hypothetical protein
VGGEVAQTMYTHVSKYKNDKRRKEKKKAKELSRAKARNFTQKFYIIRAGAN